MATPRLTPTWWVIRAGNSTRRQPGHPRVWSVYESIGNEYTEQADAQRSAEHWGAEGTSVEVVRAVFIHIEGPSSGGLLEVP